MKNSLLAVFVTFCTVAALICFWAAPSIQHNPGWELVQAGVVFVGILYALIAIVLLETAGRRARNIL